MLDGIGLIALILLAAFVVDRVTTALLLLVPARNTFLAQPKVRRFIYFAVAGLIGTLVLAYWGEVKVFRSLGFNATNDWLDIFFSGVIFAAAADWIGAWGRKNFSAGGQSESKPAPFLARTAPEESSAKRTAASSE
jgi:hypothetical protein